MIKKIKMIIERGPDNFAAYAEDDGVFGVWGVGDTVDGAKHSVVEAIEILKKYNKKENIPEVLLGDYELVYED